jgi:hypothetical protein
MLAGFVLACLAVVNERGSIRSWATLALAVAVVRQLVYLYAITPLY